MNHPRSPRHALHSLPILAAFVALIAAAFPATAGADRRYFLYTYSPWIDHPGEIEIETWATARTGKQDPALGTLWEPRAELEYTFNPRLAAAAYLNFTKAPGRSLKFDSPSIELIYALAEPGKIAGDPALYLEATESGDELELEPKLLLAHRRDRWVGAVNLIGEFEFRHDDEERPPNGEVLNNAFAGELSGGIAYDLSPRVSLGFESRYRTEHPNFGGQSAALFAMGPSFNLRIGEAQLGIAVLPQVWGTPATSGHRNLNDFEKVQTRVVLGFEL